MILSSNEQQVGDILRHWRGLRRFSQMELALSANVSTRHLSFVETGRSKPSRELLLRLAEVLHLPHKHVNFLLISAGYAPQYTDLPLDDDRMEDVRSILQRLLQQHEPYPAVVLNRTYDILLTNKGYNTLIGQLASLDRFDNVYRLMFSPDGLQPYIANRNFVYAHLLARLHEESIVYQSEQLASLYRECRASCGELEPLPRIEQQVPILSFSYIKDGFELEFVSTITTFGTAIDINAQELRIESLFPVNDAARLFFTM